MADHLSIALRRFNGQDISLRNGMSFYKLFSIKRSTPYSGINQGMIYLQRNESAENPDFASVNKTFQHLKKTYTEIAFKPVIIESLQKSLDVVA